MVPKLAEAASQLTVFMRNNTYIAPSFGSNVSNKEADPDSQDPAAAGKHKYTEKEKQRFREDPAYLLKYRTTIERQIANSTHSRQNDQPDEAWRRGAGAVY